MQETSFHGFALSHWWNTNGSKPGVQLVHPGNDQWREENLVQQKIVETFPIKKHGNNRHQGPSTITNMYDNGTVRLRQRTPAGGAVFQTWNIQKVFHTRSDHPCITTVRRAVHVKIPSPLFVYILCSKLEPTMVRGQMQYTGFYAT
jgi:hypothetical protein